MPDRSRGPLTPSEVGARLKSVRVALGLSQLEFIALLWEKLGYELRQSELSRIESGKQAATLEDFTAFAAVDPLQRGRAWLAFEDGPMTAGQGGKTISGTADEVLAALEGEKPKRKHRTG